MNVDRTHTAEFAKLRLKRDRTKIAMKKIRRYRRDLPSLATSARQFMRQPPVESDAVRVRDGQQAAGADGHNRLDATAPRRNAPEQRLRSAKISRRARRRARPR